MTKNTKTLLTIGGIAVVGYILWKRGVFGGKKSFAGFTASDNFLNLGGRTTSRTRGGLPICRQGCMNSSGQLIRTGSGQTGQCVVQVHDIEGNVSSLAYYTCTGTTEADLTYNYSL